ncbi:MAG: HD domain-containing phosphohydrolase [Actinomycetota bacterium]
MRAISSLPDGVESHVRAGPDLVDARILMVDDEPANVLLLERILGRAGYRNVRSTTDPEALAGLISESRPDLLLLDLKMPRLDGFTILERLRTGALADPDLPILVLTADATRDAKRRALAAGARDFLTKPLDVDEVLLRIQNMLDIRFLTNELKTKNLTLEDRVLERTRELEESHIETFERLALAAEYRDDDTGQHTRRVGRMAALLGQELGLASELVELLERAAGLHDVGKIGVPDSILLAPRKLTSEEFDIVKTHTVIGAKILSGSRSPLMRMAEEIAWSHHERWDGGGYAGAIAEEIPLMGRITTVADVFDALTHQRPYKEAWPLDRAIEEIRQQRGDQFDPDIVDAFLSIQEDVAVAAVGIP